VTKKNVFYDLVFRPLRNQYQYLQHQQTQQHQQHYFPKTSPPSLAASEPPDNGLEACDSLLRSLLNLRQHCDFVQPFMNLDTEYNGEKPLSLTRFEILA
jgi:hypothetical protein